MFFFKISHLRRLLFSACLLGGLVSLLAGAAPGGAGAWILRIDGSIGPATADYLVRNLEQAKTQGVKLVVLQMDTPGGLDSAMRDMVQAIIASPVPVATYVAPAGARAASAGTYILYASHVAAMAPGTNLGAATPVQIGAEIKNETLHTEESKPAVKEDNAKKEGDKTNLEKFIEKVLEEEPGGEQKKKSDDTMKAKLVNDAEAYLRSLAEVHGRNAEWAASAVRESASLPAREALEKGVIDLIAQDVDDLIEQIDGREIKLAGQSHTLLTTGLVLHEVEPDWRNRLLAILTDPNVAYIFMLLGIYGLFFEFSNPGAVIPGVLGGISLLLALFAFQILPVNYAGLALILLGITFMVSEAFIPSFGALGIGGVVAFVIGSIILMDTEVPGFGISRNLIFAVGIVSAFFFFWTVSNFIRLRRKPAITGGNAMIGMTGKCIGGDGTHLQIFVHSEIWEAESHSPVHKGDEVRVVGIEGLRLTVEPMMPPQELDFVLKDGR